MNREIKYRQPIRNREGLFKEWFYWGFIDDMWISPAMHLSGVDTRTESQQFTGLTDKNGKDIYEWDIVKWYNGSMMPPNTDEANKYFQAIHGNEDFEKPNYDVWDKIYSIKPVVFENGCFKPKDNNPFFSAHLSPSQIEIIGNIYENPELINP